MKSIQSKSPSILLAMLVGLTTPVFGGVNYEEAPIHYSTTLPENIVSQLQTRLDAGEAKLAFDGEQGYLRAVLQLLDVPLSSQVLVFSKTSLQDDKISPQTPRAIYFNDSVHVGFVQRGMIEIAVTDPKLGMAFYTLQQSEVDKPAFRQEANSCLNCHGAARTKSVPGVLVRSVFPDPKGQPVIAAGSFLSTTSSPIDQRWGGWYVTGTHGAQNHLGNMTLPDAKKPKVIENPEGLNVTDLSSRFDTTKYLTPHSDPVAFMVLEHQAEVLNLMTKAGFETRYALRLRDQAVREKPDSAASAGQEALTTIERAAQPLVDALLLKKEVPLTAPIQGTSPFATEFPQRGSRTPDGHTLRELDMQTGMFRHSCSYMLDTPAFRQLPRELRQTVLTQVQAALTSPDPGKSPALIHRDQESWQVVQTLFPSCE